jgi:hypothetical protein
MDGNRFDRLTRLLASATSRRNAVKGALGVAFGGAAAASIVDDGEAIQCRRGGSYCTRNSQCCSGTCRTGSRFPTKVRNRCSCGAGQADCGGSCVTLGTNLNCASCGNKCKANEICLSGRCQNVIRCGDDYCDRATEICVENSVCCDKGSNHALCDGACCDGHCCDGTCCPDGKKCVGWQCCEESDNDALCGGECCANVCADGTCCLSGEIECENECWDGLCIEGVQCPTYAVDTLCNGECCHEGGCINGEGCCPYGEKACDGECCDGDCSDGTICCTTTGDVACNGECCTNCVLDEAGGNVCCDDPDAREYCEEDGCCVGTCIEGRCCEAGEILCNGQCCYGTCTDDVTCCPPGEWAAANGECCADGQSWCGDACCDGSCALDIVTNGEICCETGGDYACDGTCCRPGQACFDYAGVEICAWGPACQEDDDCPSVDGYVKCCRGTCSTLNDLDNCGECGHAGPEYICADGQVCSFGECVSA